jgi:Uri superfamily endonuclease
MTVEPTPRPGCVTYQLHIRVRRRLRLRIGHLGVFDFPRGTYVYTGSARTNLEARIARHLSKDKRLRWHIDFLLAADGVDVVRVVRSTHAECESNQQVRGAIVAAGFGASDCRSRCGSHLKRLHSR